MQILFNEAFHLFLRSYLPNNDGIEDRTAPAVAAFFNITDIARQKAVCYAPQSKAEESLYELANKSRTLSI